ncbi:hypothetical protein [Sphingomonas sp. 8AM]|uniref:hypothetical protein n=1 Tax=Sphingomonas sp. 8AM TaxID=2653170 RepID=UPI0012F1AE52|nr:hypothetical protein [Sphingomonas sp. 8AM]VXC62966.1 conserved exported hypothetical protein [Sphingomonas sp. 8AM]
MLPSLFLCGLAAPAIAQPPPAPPDQVRDGSVALQARRQGRLLPLPEIERRVVPTMRDAQYIGFDLEMPSGIYTLKFLKKGAVIWVDVDGRTGQILGRTGR